MLMEQLKIQPNVYNFEKIFVSPSTFEIRQGKRKSFCFGALIARPALLVCFDRNKMAAWKFYKFVHKRFMSKRERIDHGMHISSILISWPD